MSSSDDAERQPPPLSESVLLDLAGYSVWPLQLGCDIWAGHEPGEPARVLLDWYVGGCHYEMPVETLRYDGASQRARKYFAWARNTIRGQGGELQGARQAVGGEEAWWVHRVEVLRWGYRFIPRCDRPTLLGDRRVLARLGFYPTAGLGPLFPAAAQQPLVQPVRAPDGHLPRNAVRRGAVTTSEEERTAAVPAVAPHIHVEGADEIVVKGGPHSGRYRHRDARLPNGKRIRPDAWALLVEIGIKNLKEHDSSSWSELRTWLKHLGFVDPIPRAKGKPFEWPVWITSAPFLGQHSESWRPSCDTCAKRDSCVDLEQTDGDTIPDCPKYVRL